MIRGNKVKYEPAVLRRQLDPNHVFLIRMLRFIETYELRHEIFWKVTGITAQFYVNCNDVFFWGCADYEHLTSDTLPLLQKAIRDCEKAKSVGRVYGSMLYCARQRKMRPQGAAYPIFKELWSLFDACGDERETGFGNPMTPEKMLEDRHERNNKTCNC